MYFYQEAREPIKTQVMEEEWSTPHSSYSASLIPTPESTPSREPVKKRNQVKRACGPLSLCSELPKGM